MIDKRFAFSCAWEEIINGAFVKSTKWFIKIVEAKTYGDAQIKFECLCKSELNDSYFQAKWSLLGIEIPETTDSRRMFDAANLEHMGYDDFLNLRRAHSY